MLWVYHSEESHRYKVSDVSFNVLCLACQSQTLKYFCTGARDIAEVNDGLLLIGQRINVTFIVTFIITLYRIFNVQNTTESTIYIDIFTIFIFITLSNFIIITFCSV